MIVNLASKAGQFWQQNIEQVKSLLTVNDWDQITSLTESQDIEHVRATTFLKKR